MNYTYTYQATPEETREKYLAYYDLMTNYRRSVIVMSVVLGLIVCGIVVPGLCGASWASFELFAWCNLLAFILAVALVILIHRRGQFIRESLKNCEKAHAFTAPTSLRFTDDHYEMTRGATMVKFDFTESLDGCREASHYLFLLNGWTLRAIIDLDWPGFPRDAFIAMLEQKGIHRFKDKAARRRQVIGILCLLLLCATIVFVLFLNAAVGK